MDHQGPPEAHIRIDGSQVRLLGTIPGFVPDADRVRQAFETTAPSVIALGVPPEDLEALTALMDDPALGEELEPDELDGRLLDLLRRFGDVDPIPSPDLAAANAADVPMEAVDMDDAHHTLRYTQLVKMRHLAHRGAIRRRLGKWDFKDAADAYALVREWDGQLGKVKPLARLDAEREQQMADGIRGLAGDHDRIVAVVHAARFEGVRALLTNGP